MVRPVSWEEEDELASKPAPGHVSTWTKCAESDKHTESLGQKGNHIAHHEDLRQPSDTNHGIDLASRQANNPCQLHIHARSEERGCDQDCDLADYIGRSGVFRLFTCGDGSDDEANRFDYLSSAMRIFTAY